MPVKLLLIGLLLGPGILSIQSVSPPESPEEISVPATLTAQPATRLLLGSFTIHFEETTLGEILGLIKLGHIAHEGDAGASVYWLCYALPEAGVPHRLWLTAGAMGGAEHRVTGVMAAPMGAAESVSEGCPALPSSLQPVSLDRGIWVGTTGREITRVLGEASGSRDDWLVFFYLGKLRRPFLGLADAEESLVDFDEMSFLEVRVVDDAVVALDAGKVTSY